MPKRKTYLEVKDLFTTNGYELVTLEYLGAGYKLHTKCKNGHDFMVTYTHFRIGTRCTECSGFKRRTLDEVKLFIEEKGFVLIDNQYINNTTKMQMKCPRGHDCYISYNAFTQGNRCITCYGNKTKTIEEARIFIEKEGYKLISDFYINNSTRLHLTCQKGHDYFTNLRYFVSGYRCGKCSEDRRRKTCLERYGVVYPTQSADIALKGAKSSAKTIMRYHWKTNEELFCIGGWESKVVDYLNTNKINYEWQPKTFSIPKKIYLTPKGNKVTYRPDLFLNDEQKWIEIKGWFRDDAQIKWDWFKSKHPTAELWDKKKLTEMGILKNQDLSTKRVSN